MLSFRFSSVNANCNAKGIGTGPCKAHFVLLSIVPTRLPLKTHAADNILVSVLTSSHIEPLLWHCSSQPAWNPSSTQEKEPRSVEQELDFYPLEAVSKFSCRTLAFVVAGLLSPLPSRDNWGCSGPSIVRPTPGKTKHTMPTQCGHDKANLGGAARTGTARLHRRCHLSSGYFVSGNSL